MTDERTITLFDNEGVTHLRIDAPGERAVSAPITDAASLIQSIADAAGFVYIEGAS